MLMKNRMLRLSAAALSAALLLGLAGCGASSAEDIYTKSVPLGTIVIEEEAVALGTLPALASDLMPTATGALIAQGGNAVIDYSNTADGYVMVKYTAADGSRLKVQLTGPSGTTYTYNLAADNAYDTFPLSDGNGSYKIGVYKNVSGTSYSVVTTATISASLRDQFAPFLLPNQYVDYNASSACVVKAKELNAGTTDLITRVNNVYNFVVNYFTYDTAKAASVQSGYLPDLNAVYAAKKGICFDYAATMAAMLRSNGIPTKLVVGYSGSAYHAWINVYSPESGWIDGVIYFDGTSWKLMDPTFASSGKQSQQILDYIGNGANYTAKYTY